MVLSNKPWNQLEESVGNEVILPRGMIGPEERRCYHYLARHAIKGKGAIVDAGSFIGASAFCFASGAALNDRIESGRPLIHCYDQFKLSDEYVRQFLVEQGHPIQMGESFRHIFQWQTAKYGSMITPHEGDFLTARWEGGRIDILFIDIAKRTNLNSHVVAEFFPHLMPGESFVIQQDFFHGWHPYIHITMEFLAHRFEIVDGFVPFNSRIYRLLSAVSEDEIQRLARYDFSPEDRLTLLDRFIAKESGDMRAMARTLKLCQLWMDNNLPGFAKERQRMAAEFPTATSVDQLDSLVARGIACDWI